MSITQIVILIVLTLLCLLVFFVVIAIFTKKPSTTSGSSATSGSTAGATAPPVLPASVAPPCPAPVVPATPARTSVSSSTSTRTSSKGVFGTVVKFIVGLLTIVVLLVFLVIGGWSLKNLIDRYNSSNDEELVVVQPGRTTFKSMCGKTNCTYKCSAPTVIEYLDINNRRIPVLLNGRLVDYVILGPGKGEVSIEPARERIEGMLFTSADSSNMREYSFVLRRR